MADWYKASLVATTTNTSGSASTGACSIPVPQGDHDDDTTNTSELRRIENTNAKEKSSYGRCIRSPVVCRHAAVACSQPLAGQIGLDLLKNHKANAADAAIAIAAALAVTEPCSTGLGGDMFCLYYNATTKQVTCINGSGKSPMALSYEQVEQSCPTQSDFAQSPLSVTVPGAAMGWYDLYNQYGSKNISFAELLEPAAKLAEEGFPVAPVTSFFWNADMGSIKRWYTSEEISDPNFKFPLTSSITNEAPKPGEIIHNPDMANVLRELGTKGPIDGFYTNWIGQSIVDIVQKHGGCLSMEDLRNHTSNYPDPIAVQYRNVKLWQIPPNGQGIAGLIALAGLQHLEQSDIIIEQKLSPSNIGSSDYYHTLIEMMRLGFADARAYVSDPDYMINKSCEELLDPIRIGQRAEQLFNPSKAVIHGLPDASSCTVSFQVVDTEGNATSFVNSNFMGFGTGIVPNKCGFTIQNRGCGFTIDDPNHPNAVGPAKRPYHTIIPGMITHAVNNNNDEDENNDLLYATISNMGGNMQPQGHVQLLVNMVAGQMDPQAAIDAPRFCIADGTQNGVVLLETGVPDRIVQDLIENKGHYMKPNIQEFDRSVFGRAQIIYRDHTTGVLWAGSDGRADGCAMGF